MEASNDAATLVEEPSEWTGSYTWRVKNWTRLTRKTIFSPEFDIGGYTWSLLVYPRGNNSQRTSGYIAVHLNFREASFTPVQMRPWAKFQLMAVKTNAPKESLKREATHTFTNQAANWGFTQFLSIQEAQNPENGYLVNDTLTMCVSIYLEEMDGVLATISKLETGFIGIKSLKETSLLTSYLQCLFHIKPFRKAVFQMPTVESDDPQKSLPLALQQLFYALQYQNTSAKTNALFKALDWDFASLHLRHEFLEMQCTLFEKLDGEDKADNVKKCISDLFIGVCSTYNNSPTVPEAQTYKESYIDIPLDILECRDTYASLEKFYQTNRLEGGNHNCMDNHAVVESKCKVLFESLPTVLLFRLKRCFYTLDHKTFLKMNSRYEFYDELDLDYGDHALLLKNADKTIENKYRLHSVLVHEDGPNEGRYSTFIRCDETWYKFDGEAVKAVSIEEAIDAQFGDRNGTASANFSERFERINKSAAVALIYVRKSEWSTIMCDAGKENIPKQVRERFDKEKMEMDENRKKKDAHLYVNITLAIRLHFDEQLDTSFNFDLTDFETVKNYRIYKKTPFEDFKEMVSKDFGIPIHLQRFWLWSKRQNNTMRVSKPLIESKIDIKTILDLKHYRDKSSPPDQEKTAVMTIKLFLESPEKAAITEGTLRPIRTNELLILLKYYDPELSRLSYLGHMLVEKICSFRVILARAKKMAGIALDEEVIGFEELKHSPAIICLELLHNSTPKTAQIIQGDIVIIQKRTNNIHCQYPTVRSFLEFIKDGVTVTFKPLKHPTDGGFKLDLFKTLTYEQVTTELAKHLQVEDSKKLRLTQHNVCTHTPNKSPIKYNGIEFLEQMIWHARQYTHILYYEVLDMQLPYLETLKCLTIGFHNVKGEWQSEHELRLLKDKKVSDLLRVLKVELGEEYNDCDLRIMEILSSKVFRVLDSDSVLEQLYERYWIFRAEVIPEDQKKLKSDEFLVLFCHCKPDDKCLTVFGDPLWVKVKKGETVREVRARIQRTLEITDEEFNDWRFAYHARPLRPLEYLKEEDEVLAKFPRSAINGRTNGKFVGDNTAFIALVHESTRHDTQTPDRRRSLFFPKCLSCIHTTYG